MLPVLRLTALFSVLATEAWLLWNPKGLELKWDALAAFFAALLALFALERKEHAASSVASPSPTMPIVSSMDAEQFERILELLSPTGVVQFLRNHDFGGSFEREDIQPLRSFVALGGNPDAEFIDPALETERKRLFENASELSMAIATKTAPTFGDRFSVLPKHLASAPRPDWVNREAKELNESATAFVELYDDFVRFCRSRIAGSAV